MSDDSPSGTLPQTHLGNVSSNSYVASSAGSVDPTISTRVLDNVEESPETDISPVARDNEEEDHADSGIANDAETVSHNTTAPIAKPALPPEKQVEEFRMQRNVGALQLGISGPHAYSTRVKIYQLRDRDDDDDWQRAKGDGTIQEPTHASFGKSGSYGKKPRLIVERVALYKKKRFIRTEGKDIGRYTENSEDSVLFDVESHPEYENINPGTVSADGFALDAWDYEETHHPRWHRVRVACMDVNSIPIKRLNRRVHELKTDTGELGWDPQKRLLDLVEFFPEIGYEYSSLILDRQANKRQCRSRHASPAFTLRTEGQIFELLGILNSGDLSIDFRSKPSVGQEWRDPAKPRGGLWDVVLQVITAKELALRLGYSRTVSWGPGLNSGVVASMIIADQWLKHIDIATVRPTLDLPDTPPPAETLAQAEEYKSKGDEAFSKKHYAEALELYTQAAGLNQPNAVYMHDRAAALYELERYDASWRDAFIATILDPKSAEAWCRFGLASMKMDRAKDAIQAYKEAIAIAADAATEEMRRGLDEAKARNKALLDIIDTETDVLKREVFRREYLEQDFAMPIQNTVVRSLVHAQQVEGLLLFAEKLEWPWIEETRIYSGKAYSNFEKDGNIHIDLYDWLFGMVLPGKWFARKIMTALILCTPSISKVLSPAPDYDCGLSLQDKSYWRARTVLGRVLGCLPGVISLCGWIGPCPPVEFIPGPAQSHPLHVYLETRELRLAVQYSYDSGDAICSLPLPDRHDDTRLQPDEDPELWSADICDPHNWVIPEPPVQQQARTCEMKAVQLRQSETTDHEKGDHDQDLHYRAQVVFKLGNSDELITYKLSTNPVFVTVPPCSPGPKGAHAVHRRELYRYATNRIWPIESLHDLTAEDTDGVDVIIINATGTGAEVLARAWCAERGKSAVIRRPGGACFACAERTAHPSGLNTGVLIWTC